MTPRQFIAIAALCATVALSSARGSIFIQVFDAQQQPIPATVEWSCAVGGSGSTDFFGSVQLTPLQVDRCAVTVWAAGRSDSFEYDPVGVGWSVVIVGE